MNSRLVGVDRDRVGLRQGQKLAHDIVAEHHAGRAIPVAHHQGMPGVLLGQGSVGQVHVPGFGRVMRARLSQQRGEVSAPGRIRMHGKLQPEGAVLVPDPQDLGQRVDRAFLGRAQNRRHLHHRLAFIQTAVQQGTQRHHVHPPVAIDRHGAQRRPPEANQGHRLGP